MGIKIGIDLGAAYSCAAYVNAGGAVELVLNGEGDCKTSSDVFINPDGKTVIVGERAMLAASKMPDNYVKNIKYQMGDKEYSLPIAGKDYSPAEITSFILKKIKSDSEKFTDEKINGCVITCPVYFSAVAKSAIREAATKAGLVLYRIVDNYEAAAAAYSCFDKRNLDKTVLVYDLGEGFDCAVLKFNFSTEEKSMNLLLSSGDPFLGNSWHHDIYNYILDEFCDASGEDRDCLYSDNNFMVELSRNAEKIKRCLTEDAAASITVTHNGKAAVISITRDMFEAITESRLNQTLSIINEMLERGNMTANDFDEILLVGGLAKMPQIKKALSREYNKPIISPEPDMLIAYGAALIANNYGDSGIKVE